MGRAGFRAVASVAVLAALGAVACGPGLAVDGIPLDQTTWQVATIDGRPPLVDHIPTLIFAKGGVSGWAGCNSYGSTSVAISGHGLAMTNLGMTAMACVGPDGNTDNPVMDAEAAFFRALGAATQIAVVDGRLVLSGPAGEIVFEHSHGLVPAAT